ncbi:TVP38/TMEM64 family protein [Halobaculum sp. CBA1158]|uniref:TVP38/TMEM64 family protein n=1 Tax=Halobaculum sp. CBA1158 TaxID=2904243 RepID=UPI001F34E06D|nr:TVP38/TMEM64 family protein [Halobaculum sp. CBA1158]UIO99464.1 TVP38/TMEM64 family protein [Halobaculum sp. CBA1158]
MNRRVLAGGAIAAGVLLAAVLTSPAAVLDRVSWIVADPVRLLAVLIGLAIVRPILAWPVTLVAVLAGYGFGLAAAPLSLGLMVLTSVPPFLFARRGRIDGGGGIVGGGGRAGAAVDRLVGAGERAVSVAGGTRSVAASRLLPIPSDAVSVGAGLAGVKTVPFVLGSAIGELPWAVAGTVAGASAGRIATDGLSEAFDPRLVATAGLAGLLLLAGPAYRYYAARPE